MCVYIVVWLLLLCCGFIVDSFVCVLRLHFFFLHLVFTLCPHCCFVALVLLLCSCCLVSFVCLGCTSSFLYIVVNVCLLRCVIALVLLLITCCVLFFVFELLMFIYCVYYASVVWLYCSSFGVDFLWIVYVSAL